MISLVLTRFLLFTILVSTATAGRVAPVSRRVSRQTLHARGGNHQYVPSLRHRQLLHPMHHGHGGTSYLGCLNYTNTELSSEWKFSGDAPDCSYVSHGSDNDDDDDDDDDDGGDDDGDDDDGGEDDGNDDGDDDGNENRNGDDDEAKDDDEAQDDDAEDDQVETDDEVAADQDDAYGDNGGGGDGRNGYDEDGYVVSNEDVSEGNYDNENPMESFNITECNTYENLWVWDLAFSCESDVALANCECTFTEQLMQADLLTCNDIESCPKECPVCETCFKLVGCAPVPDVFIRTGVSASTLFAICAAIGLFFFGVSYYYCRHRKNGGEENSLEAHLIDKDVQGAVHKTPQPDKKESGGYDPEVELGPYPDIPDFRSDLSSLDSRTVDEASTPLPTVDGQGVPGVPNQISLSQAQPENADVLLDVQTEQNRLSGLANEKSTEHSVSIGTGTATSTLVVPDSTATEIPVANSTVWSSIAGTYQPPQPIAIKREQNAAIETPGTPTTPSTNASNSEQKSLPDVLSSAANNDATITPPVVSAHNKASAPSSTPPNKDGNVPVVAPNNSTSSQRIIPPVVSARKRPKAQTEAENDGQKAESPDVFESTLTPATNDAEHDMSTKVQEEQSSRPVGDTAPEEGNDELKTGSAHKPSDASDASPSEESVTPWIGDIDLSYTEPSCDEDDENIEPTPEEIVASKYQDAAAVEQDSGDTETSPGEPTSVWLAPLDDLEGPSDGAPITPLSEAQTATAEADPSVVWLAPACSPAELAPETNDEDSVSSSSWSPDDEGPWLAPI